MEQCVDRLGGAGLGAAEEQRRGLLGRGRHMAEPAQFGGDRLILTERGKDPESVGG